MPQRFPASRVTAPAGHEPDGGAEKVERGAKEALSEAAAVVVARERRQAKRTCARSSPVFWISKKLAHRSLARHWDGLTPKQRSEFVSVLRDLIERNYIKQVHGQPNYDLRFEKETITGAKLP